MKPYGIIPPKQTGTFIFSLDNFLPIIKKILANISPMSFCEIGIEGKIMTNSIIDFASQSMLRVYGIDPSVSVKPDYENYVLIQKPSFIGLNEIDSCDVFFVDGDHNYYTVLFELNKIKSISASKEYFPIVFLHDVAWPNDRRDAYYLPSFMPAEKIHEYSVELGVNPESEELHEYGMASGDEWYCFRKERGNIQNGVLTALEDFVMENSEWHYLLIPGIFGLGIIYKSNCPADFQKTINELAVSIDWFYEEISILEYNRLSLFCEKIKMSFDINKKGNELDQTRNELDQVRNELNQTRNELNNAYEKYYKKVQSWSYRIGRFITSPAWILSRIIKKVKNG